MKKTAMIMMGAALIASAIVASATENLTIKIPSVTSGKCAMTLLEADGIRPLGGASLKLQATKDGTEAASEITDKAGKCIVRLEEGRYILNVNGKNLTLVDASEKGEMAWCRIVVSDKPMLVGGQVEGEVVAVSGGLFGSGTVGTIAIVAGTTVVVAGGVSYAVEEHEDDGDGIATVTVVDETPVTGGGGTPPPASP